MTRVVFDTVVLVRGLINPHSFCGRLLFSYSDRYRLFVSEPVVNEMLEVLQRPELTRKFRSLANFNLRRVIEILADAEVVSVTDVPDVARDPKDDKFLATAAGAAADYLVTEDEDLLVLKEHKGVRIVQAQSFLKLLEESQI